MTTNGHSRPPAPSADELKAYALRLLTRREYGERELAARLARKWGEEAVTADALSACVAQLAQAGLVSDRRFAEAFVRVRVHRGQGPVRIRAELQQRGVAAEVIADVLDEHEAAWTGRAFEWLERHCPGSLDRAGRGRYYRRLRSRGFGHDQALGALDRYARALSESVPGRSIE